MTKDTSSKSQRNVKTFHLWASVEETYANAEFLVKSGDPNQTGQRSSERKFHGAVAVCLGLLSFVLLVGLITLSVYYHGSVHDSAAELSTVKSNLTQSLQAIFNLTEERDQLNTRLSKLTEELNRLQDKTCPTGWTIFSVSCYLLSSQSGSWEEGSQDCRARGADLVVIDSSEEQKFLSGFTQGSWLGLNDMQNEGSWRWIDNTPLTLSYWAENQPDNYQNEDCAHIKHDHFWNDVSCTASYQWVCEKKA